MRWCKHKQTCMQKNTFAVKKGRSESLPRVLNVHDWESQISFYSQWDCIYPQLLCPQNLTSWHVTDFLPTCYSSVHSHPHICLHCSLHATQCHLWAFFTFLCNTQMFVFLSLKWTGVVYVCVCACVRWGGGGSRVCVGYKIRVQASSTTFLEASQLCGNQASTRPINAE